MKVPFAAISAAGLRYTFDDLQVASVGEDFKLQGPVRFSCVLHKKSEYGIVMQGVVQARVLLCCDRCLTLYPYRVYSDMHLIFEVGHGEHFQVKDVDLPVEDLNIIELSEPVIDFVEVVREQLYIALPTQKLCNDNCKGICPECGGDLNVTPCSCREKVISSPFAALGALKKR